jgi:hypothetical protein
MHVETALRAVHRPRLELAVEVGLHLEELEPKHLGVVGDRVIGSSSTEAIEAAEVLLLKELADDD